MKEGLSLLSLFPPLPTTSQGCVHVCLKTKEWEKAAKNTMETDAAEIVMGSVLIASLLTQINPEMFYIEHWLKGSLLTAWSFYLYQSILCSARHEFAHNSVENCHLQKTCNSVTSSCGFKQPPEQHQKTSDFCQRRFFVCFVVSFVKKNEKKKKKKKKKKDS